jgi:hypothetical protein
MSARTYCVVSSLVFAVVALGHLVRAARGLPVTVGAWDVSVAISWVGGLAAAALAAWGMLASRRAA